ncbi:glycoside hydrolase family 55 protein [Streptomyces parvus]|uniref:glycoside hydrolase family 55 protein n=1 Tax=Streptomyces parvus TaxID=66428 RepID=UPI0021012368|nr:glycoside hydrolase family 55 protein [Streptomyces parvus]MCQ1575372.1 glycoside hydrolase family 55 protein [Streptomyces parvus]
MPRHIFGGSTSDYAMERVGSQLLVRPGATGTIWDAATGGTQITDLTDLTGTPITTVTADTDGAVAFYGPDDVTHLYMDFGYNRRYAAAAVDLGQILQTHLAQRDQPGGWPSLDSGGRISPAQVSGALDWLTVTAYGAVGDGVADDTPAILAAINACPVGGVVYFPAGVYRITETLDKPMGITLQGTHSNLMVGPGMTDDDFACWIQPDPAFDGDSVIQIIGEDDGTHPDISGEQRIRNLMIDGSKLTGSSIDGIFAKGNVQNVILDDVCIRQMPNNGIVTADRTDGVFPYSWRLRHVMIDNCHANGVLFNGNTDLTLDDVQVIGCWGRGFVLQNCTNAQLLACRAEWNGSHGYHITGAWGDWQGSGGMQTTGCSTDRNGGHGMLVDATGNGPILITGLQTRRDGRNGGTGGDGLAGLAITAATMPVTITGITCYPGVDDGGTSTNSPEYGLSVTGASTLVQVDNGYLHAATQGLHSTSTGTLMVGTNMGYATGPTDAPVRTLPLTASVSKALVVTAPAGAATYVIWRAPKACTVTAVRGYRVGGTGTTINATKNGADLLATNLSLSTADTWLAGPGVQNETMAAGDTLAVAVRSVTGTPTAVTIQVDVQGV